MKNRTSKKWCTKVLDYSPFLAALKSYHLGGFVQFIQEFSSCGGQLHLGALVLGQEGMWYWQT